MIKLSLSQKEKRVIVQAVEIQVNNLTRIASNEIPIDLELFCIQNNIARNKLRKMAIKNMLKFSGVKEDPTTLLTLDNDNLRIFRHILNTMVKGKKKEKKVIWRKLFQFEKMVTLYHPN